jgi:hypothetical protein
MFLFEGSLFSPKKLAAKQNKNQHVNNTNLLLFQFKFVLLLVLFCAGQFQFQGCQHLQFAISLGFDRIEFLEIEVDYLLIES